MAALLNLSTQQALNLWRLSLLASVRGEGPDLTARQMAVMLSVYMQPPPHTVRGLASSLALQKPAVVRALNTLEGLDFVRRRRDEQDRRNVLIQRTVKGSVFLTEFADAVVAAGRAL